MIFKTLLTRFQQRHRTMKWPAGEPPALPDRFRGCPRLDRSADAATRAACVAACPTGALTEESIDLGRCLFCGECARGAVRFSRDFRLAHHTREALIVPHTMNDDDVRASATIDLDDTMQSLIGRSFKLRQVSAGGCGACEADANVLGTIGWDMGRFGIQFVASPRHADGLLVTGPVSKHMERALIKTYEAVSTPKIVIACGACAISGGIYAGSSDVCGGVDRVIPVDAYVPGCPPHPLTLLHALLTIIRARGKHLA